LRSASAHHQQKEQGNFLLNVVHMFH
jgi:hypothetical protein